MRSGQMTADSTSRQSSARFSWHVFSCGREFDGLSTKTAIRPPPNQALQLTSVALLQTRPQSSLRSQGASSVWPRGLAGLPSPGGALAAERPIR